MKDDSISDLKAGDEVTLRGVVEQTTPYAVKVRFPGMHLAAWLTQDAVGQPHFVRAAPPAVRQSYDALKHAADWQKRELNKEKAKVATMLHVLHLLDKDAVAAMTEALILTTCLSEDASELLAGEKVSPHRLAEHAEQAARCAKLAGGISHYFQIIFQDYEQEH